MAGRLGSPIPERMTEILEGARARLRRSAERLDRSQARIDRSRARAEDEQAAVELEMNKSEQAEEERSE